MFSRGDLIEVCSKETGFVGSYYAATVVSQLRKDLFVVQYKDLVEGVINMQPLVETVRLNELRPVPPQIDSNDDEFGYLDQVDAFDNDGWWVGRVYGRTDDDNYVVYFETTGDEIAYSRSRLRVHLDWVKGKWVSCNNNKVDYREGRDPRSVDENRKGTNAGD
ncbi:protein AGENET DOMAIN (AGD)-CONTAINING P1-like [Humulus lupulus]|uniref:protein AGENET DOMAIN (AGD)-CONTAINING P1-like n=1 Tax=Humulus lupulus TaxID=3486 RepID=UPI002B40E45A|nr:protein AGENET DOMAIN (AGD)-CONTAINING P1-like [Humulus lupulus]XP_062102979.1 protein AGENET DOMAIN (AGD)-CONTAINING P1-like [Humulus lupulus]